MICFVMVALAFIDGILGVFLPQIKPELGINDTQASAIFVVNLLGFCVFTSIGGHLCDKIGSRKSFFLLLGTLLLFCLAMLCAHTYARLILLSFILYCALAALTVTVNSFIPSLFTTSQAFFMSFFHLVNYGGIALSKTTAGLLIRHNVNWRFIYLIIAAILIICLGLWHFSFFPAPVVPDTEKKPERTLPLKHIFSTAFFLYVAAVGGYLSSVTAMHNWFVISYEYCQGLLCLFSVFYFFCTGKRVPRPVHQTSWRIQDCFSSVVRSLFLVFAWPSLAANRPIPHCSLRFLSFCNIPYHTC